MRVVEVKPSDSQCRSCLNTCSIPFVDGTVVAARAGNTQLPVCPAVVQSCSPWLDLQGKNVRGWLAEGFVEVFCSFVLLFT